MGLPLVPVGIAARLAARAAVKKLGPTVVGRTARWAWPAKAAKTAPWWGKGGKVSVGARRGVTGGAGLYGGIAGFDYGARAMDIIGERRTDAGFEPGVDDPMGEAELDLQANARFHREISKGEMTVDDAKSIILAELEGGADMDIDSPVDLLDAAGTSRDLQAADEVLEEGNEILNSLLQDMGVDPESFGLFGSQTERVMVGHQPGLVEAGPLAGAQLGFMEPQYADPMEVLEGFQDMEGQELQDIQMKMFAAGFYGSTGYEDIRWGFAGPETLQAASHMLEWSMTYRNKGQQVPWWQALDDIVEASGGVVDEEEFGPLIQTADPVGLASAIDGTFQSVAGRHASTEEKRAFVALIHRLQRQQQTDLQTLRFGEVPGVDIGAQAEAFAHEQAPEDVMDVGIRSAYGGFGGGR